MTTPGTRGTKKGTTTSAGGTARAPSSSTSSSSSSSSSSAAGTAATTAAAVAASSVVSVAATTGEEEDLQGEESSSEEEDEEEQQQDEDQGGSDSDTETKELAAELAQAEQEFERIRQVEQLTVKAVQQQAIRDKIKAVREAQAQFVAQTAVGKGTTKRQTTAAASASVPASGTQPVSTTAASQIKTVDPPTLRVTEIAKGTVLEDWIYVVERIIAITRMTDFNEQMLWVSGFHDRHISLWWKGHQEMTRARGEPVTSWAGWVAAMRANYTPISDIDTACGLMFQLTMGAGESIDHYVARAHELYNRIPRLRIPTEVAAELLDRGLDTRRYPIARVAMITEQQKERTKTGGKGLGFDTMRGLIVEAAVREPSHIIAAAAAAVAPYSGRRQQRVNTLGQQQPRYQPIEDETEEGQENDEEQSVNALAGASVTCYRCKQLGHFASTCTNADVRQCNKCKVVGHLARDCTKQQKAGGSKPKAGGAQTTRGSKNE